MFQLEKLNALFNCQICHGVLVDPILLPCGETVCKAHTEEINKGKCISCSGTHTVPKEGFPKNRIVKHQLDLKVNEINLNFSQFKDYNKIIRDLNKNLKEIETIRKDPENYISEYFGELTRQVDLRRETLIEDIHKYSDELIQKIERLKQDCVAKSNEETKITDVLDTAKAKINDLNLMFNSLEIDDIKLEEINSQKKSKEIKDLVRPALNQYMLELQCKKYYKLVTNEIKLEDFFGSLSCFDNKKVSIFNFFQLSFDWVFSSYI